MKQSFATLLAISTLFLTATGLLAQPEIAYLIPDIGSPGMNTCVEIIAPITSKGAFRPASSDPNTGLIPPSAASIELIRPSDSNRVIVSPLVVSWDGRLITCQFFVKPGAATGPVPIRVRIDNQTSNVDTFYIVTPQTFGTKNGGGIIGSGGAWGTRSRRGAMIVDSLILGPGAYLMDVSDTDPQTVGEQGYLPAIIISKGPVRISNGAVLSVSATGKNAGPGGGGGGGYGSGPPLLGNPGERNTPLGNGFTGGTSNVPVVSSPASSFGKGTGADGRSLNGTQTSTLFSTTPPALRLYSAGPGHPFDDDGRSAGAAEATTGSGINAFGAYFGGGGNATKGTGLPAAQDDLNGQIVGNRQIVPLHGGGGGTGGGLYDSVGAGGGGGLALFSHALATVPDIQSNGANGSDGCNNCGPGSGDAASGGAGGSIIMGAKLGVDLGRANVRGGTAGRTQPSAPVASTSGNGGAGRFRHDGRINSGTLALTSGASLYTGPTTDTLTVATQPLFTVKGTGPFDPGVQTTIQVYVRGEDSPWNYSAPYVTTVKSDSTWQVEVAITTTDSLFYVFAVQLPSNSERENTDEWTRVPPLVFSQAAANILRYEPAPSIRTVSEFAFDTVLCAEIVYDTIIYSNLGAGELKVDGISLTSPDFAIVSPVAFPRSVMAGESDTIIVSFDATNRTSGLRTARISISSNDPGPGKNPWVIDIRGYSAFREYLNPRPENPPAIDFGDVPVNSSIDRKAIIRNIPDIVSTNLLIDSLWMKPPTPGIVVISPTAPKDTPVPPGDSLEIDLRYSPTAEQTLSNTYLCARIASPCLDTICWPITGRGIATVIEWSKSSLEMFIRACSSDQAAYDTLMISNSGSNAVDILSVSARPAGTFSVVEPTVPPTQPLNAGETIRVVVQYSPGTGTNASGILEILTSDPIFDSILLDINARRDSAGIALSDESVDLSSFCPNSAIDTTITIRNTGTVQSTVTLSGLTAPFSVLNAAASYTILPGRDTTVTVRFFPTAQGSFNSTLNVTSEPCTIETSITFTGDVTNPGYAIVEQPLDFGGIPAGASTQRLATVNNPGSVPIRIIGARIVPPSSELRISASQNFPVDIGAASSGTISLTYSPATTGVVPANTRLEVIIDMPCEDTISTDIAGRGVRTSLLPLPNPLNFGGVISCVTTTDTVWLYNVAIAPVTVLGLKIDPPSDEFTAELADKSTPTPLVSPADSIAVVVTFDPGTPPDGVKTATLIVQTNGPDGGEVEIQLQGRRLSESLAISGPSFATTYPGGSSAAQGTITNDGTAPIAINDLNVQAPFSIVSTSPVLPTLLAPGAVLTVNFTFEPEREGEFPDSVEIDGLFICDRIKLPISAISEPSVIAEAFWKDVSGEPGDVIQLPLVLNTDVTGTATTRYAVDASFNKTMLLPKRIVTDGTLSEGWAISEAVFDTGTVSFTASGTTPLSGSGTVVYVETIVLLGNDLSTEIASSEETAFLKGGARLVVTPGTFTLEGYCAVGSNRLVRITDDFGIKAVVPNPSSDHITVDIELAEDGRTRLRLYDSRGNLALTLLDEQMSASPHSVETQLNLPPGIYFLELETPTQTDQVRVYVQ